MRGDPLSAEPELMLAALSVRRPAHASSSADYIDELVLSCVEGLKGHDLSQRSRRP